MTQHRGRMVIWCAGILAAVAIGGCQDSAAPGPPVTGVQMARGGGGNQVVVEFKRPPSAELESFFADVATLDFASAPQPLPGKIGKYSIQTQPAPFTLSLESMAGFADGKDPQNDPACETEWFEIILDAAAANGGSLDGSLEIGASWDQQLNVGIGVIFSVTVGEWEYAIRVPSELYPECTSWNPRQKTLCRIGIPV